MHVLVGIMQHGKPGKVQYRVAESVNLGYFFINQGLLLELGGEMRPYKNTGKKNNANRKH